MALYSADKIKVRLFKAWMRRLCFQDLDKLSGLRTTGPRKNDLKLLFSMARGKREICASNTQ